MTKNAPNLRKSVSNADLYSDPSPPPPQLRHARSTLLGRANTTATASTSTTRLPRADFAATERQWDREYQLKNRHSVAGTPAGYGTLIDIEEDGVKLEQRPPPVPPKIPEEREAVSEDSGDAGGSRSYTRAEVMLPRTRMTVDDLRRLSQGASGRNSDSGCVLGSYMLDNRGGSARRGLGPGMTSGRKDSGNSPRTNAPPLVEEKRVKSHPWHPVQAKVATHPWSQVPEKKEEVKSKEGPEKYTKPFTDFMTANPTVFHAVDAVAKDLEKDGYKKLSERDSWELKAGGKYYVIRNGSSLIAFAIGEGYAVGNGAAIVAGHIDALTAKLKPIPKLHTKAGYVQLGVAPYAGGLGDTWWDRDLGIGGRVLVKENGKISTKLVKLDWPIARIPTLAPHFGAAANGPFNKETQMVPIIGLDNSDLTSTSDDKSTTNLGSFAANQPERLVKAISSELGITDYSTIINWELELFDVQPACTGGLEREFIFAGRIDDKLCSWAAIQALLNSSSSISSSGQIRMVALFDDEEVGSLLRQGAHGNFLPSVMERIVEDFADAGKASSALGRTYANSFLVSSDVIHAVNPNFLNAYLENHAPRLNVGPAISADPNGHMTTDAVSTAILTRCVEKDVGVRKVDPVLQVFQIRNDSRSGGTVGPMLSSATGIRAIDLGIPQLSMHSIRATTGSKDPGLGVFAFQSFLENFEGVDREFRE